MRYALITGGLGLIGTFIAKELLEKKKVDKVVCLDHFGRYVSSTNPNFVDYRKWRIEYLGNKVIIERGDSRFHTVIVKLLSKYKPVYIFHLAALPLAKLDNLNSEEALEGSVTSTTAIIEHLGILKKNNNYEPKKFIYASSSMIYGDFKKKIIDETHQKKPKEIYGTMKLAGEIATRGLCDFYKIKYNIVRPSAVYGPTDMNRRVSQIFIEKALKKETLIIHGKDEYLDFTYVKDIAHGMILAATSKVSGEEFNITNGKAHTLLEYAKVLKIFIPSVKYKVVSRDKFRPKRGTLSNKKAEKLINYKPKYNLTKGIREYLNFIKNKKIR
jgi:UDP-glucose 4-epimerase